MNEIGSWLLRWFTIFLINLGFLWGNSIPVLANPIHRPSAGTIPIDVEDVTSLYHQDDEKRTGVGSGDFDSYVFFSPVGVDGYEEKYIDFIKMRSGIYFDINKGNYDITVETGKNGNVSGSFKFDAKSSGRFKSLQWGTVDKELSGYVETHAISVEGKINSGKAVFNKDGFLRIAADKKYCEGSCGTLKITYSYKSLGPETGGSGRKIYDETATFNIEINEFTLMTNFKGESGFWMRSDGGVNKAVDPFRIALENDPQNRIDSHVDLDFGDKGNESLIPAFPGLQTNPDQKEEAITQLEQAEQIEDNPSAPFSINAGCDSEIASGQNIDCSLTITRKGNDSSPLTIIWVMDGFIAKEEEIIQNSSSFEFPNPPPGTHMIEVQVIDSNTGNARVSTMKTEVGGISPDQKIPAGAQTAAAFGSTALIAAWLWMEWMQAKQNSLKQEHIELTEAKDRQAWYQQQMDRNDEVRSRQQMDEAIQNTCQSEWNRYRNDLLKKVETHVKSEYLIDLLDDMHGDIYHDGRWDPAGQKRLQDLIDIHFAMDRQNEVKAEWKRVWNFYKKQEAEVKGILNSKGMMGAELVTGIITGGASDLIMMPTKAILSAIYARRRAIMLGKTGWDAAKSIITESGSSLIKDYAVGKIIGSAVEKTIGGSISLGKKLIGKEASLSVAKLWQKTGMKLGVIPKPGQNLPVIRQYWGKGPQVILDRPIFRPGQALPVGVGFENGLARIRSLNGSLADDMRSIIHLDPQIDARVDNIWTPTIKQVKLSPQEEIAKNLLNNASYKEAVRQGLVPHRIQQVVYQTRDKIAKDATAKAFQALDQVTINGKKASSLLQNVSITGTGARPLNPKAIGRFTDWDATIIAKDTGSAANAGRQAEEMFTAKFDEAVRNAGLNAHEAEVKMFSGIHADMNAQTAGGYDSEGLLHWHKVDTVFRGRSAVRLEDGSVMFNAHPDIAPMKGFGPMEAVPRFPEATKEIFDDSRRLITQNIQEKGIELDPAAILREEGKHAARVWKATNAGSGNPMPDWIKKVMRLKGDPNYSISGSELDSTWKAYAEYFDLPSNIGGEG